MSRAANLAGFSTSISPPSNLTVGVVTATSFVGNVTGNATGLSGTPNLNVGVITATSYSGDGSGLTGVGVGASSDVNTTGIITAAVFDGFIPITEKIIANDTPINNGQENLSLASTLSIIDGATFTIVDQTTVKISEPSNMKVNTIENSDGTQGPNFSGNLEFSSTAHIVLPKGTTAERPVGVSTGAMRYNTDTSNVEYYNGTSWVGVSTYSPLAGRGVFSIGRTPTTVNTLEYITIETTGNATDFGDLTVERYHSSACSSSTRGVFGGGRLAPNAAGNVMDYITIATTGNATDFGDLTSERYSLAACSSSTRGVFGGGNPDIAPYITNTIDYITIATTGNATNFGDLTVSRASLAACSSFVRGIFGGGSSPTTTNTIDYITIASVGNATNYSDLTVARYDLAACASLTRGIFGGGQTPTPATTYYNTLDYITMSTTGNATDFGDLTSARQRLGACSSSIRGVFGGGEESPAIVNTIDYITIATTGDATDFGDLTSVSSYSSACSNRQY